MVPNISTENALSLLSQPPPTETETDRRLNDRWQWQVELEDVKRKYEAMDLEKKKWQRDAEYLRKQMNTLMAQQMEKIEKEFKPNRQNIKDETEEAHRLLKVQVQKLQEMNELLHMDKAKQQTDEDTERQLQKQMWQMEYSQAAQAADKMAAASEEKLKGATVEYHNMASMSSRVESVQHIDEQVSLLFQAYEAKLKHVIINGVSVQPAAAVKDTNMPNWKEYQKLLVVPKQIRRLQRSTSSTTSSRT